MINLHEEIEKNNIIYTNSVLDALCKKISKYENQEILILGTEHHVGETEALFDALKRKYQASRVIACDIHMNKTIGIKFCSAWIKENTRLIIAVGNNNIYNHSKILSGIFNIPIVYICYDIPNIFALYPNALYVDNSNHSAPSQTLAIIVNESSLYHNPSIADSYAQGISTMWTLIEQDIMNKFSLRSISQNDNTLLELINGIYALSNKLEAQNLSAQKELSMLLLVLSKNLNFDEYIKSDLVECTLSHTRTKPNTIQNIGSHQLLYAEMFSLSFLRYFESDLQIYLKFPLEDAIGLASQQSNNFLSQCLEDQTAEHIQKTQFIFGVYKNKLQAQLQNVTNFLSHCNKVFKRLQPNAGYDFFKDINIQEYISNIKKISLTNTHSIAYNLKLTKLI